LLVFTEILYVGALWVCRGQTTNPRGSVCGQYNFYNNAKLTFLKNHTINKLTTGYC